MADISIDQTDNGLTISSAGSVIADYRIVSTVDAVNTPKPYFHPLRTLSGTVVTGFAPDDHPWHHGLQFAFPRVGDHNLWGGGTYFGPDRGYEVVDDQGSIRHLSWGEVIVSGDSVRFSHELEWVGHNGERLLTEDRDVTATIDEETESWVLQFDSTLTNATGAPIGLATPAQRGRPDGGYGGLFLRLAEDVQADRLIGDSRDLAASGDASRTLIIQAHTPDDEHITLGLSFVPGASPGVQKWLYRFAPEPFSAVGWAGAYDDGFDLGADESITFSHRLAVHDGTVDAEVVRAQL